MSAAVGLLQTDDVAPQSIVHTQTSSDRSTPCVLSTAIVRTLYVATVISSPRAGAQLLLPFCRMKRRSSLPRRLRLRANVFLLSVAFSFFSFPCPRFCLVLCSRDVGSAVSPRVASSSPGRIWCLLAGSSPPSRFPRRYAIFDVMTVGTNDLTCGFNWQCTVDDIGYAVMITARLDPLPFSHSLPRFGSTPAGRQPGPSNGSTG